MNNFIDYPNKFGAVDVAFDKTMHAFEQIMIQAQNSVLAQLKITKEEFERLPSEEKVASLRSIGITGFTLETDWVDTTLNLKLTLTGPKDGQND